MQFRLTGANVEDVQSVQLFFRPQNSQTVYSVAVPFENDTALIASQAVDLTLFNLPPYNLVTYWWELETGFGPITVPEQTVVYEDDRFAWQRMTQNGVTAHWTGNGPFFGQTVLDVTAVALDELARVLPLQEIAPFDVYVYPSSADLRAALRLTRLSDEDLPRPELGVLLVTAVNPETAEADLRQAIPQELTHLLLYRVTGDNYASLPQWLSAGLAATVQADPDPRYAPLLETAVVSGTTIPLAQLCSSLPTAGDPALLARAQSAAFITYLEQRFGRTAVADLVSAYAGGAACQEGVQQVLGTSLDELNAQWLAAQQPRSPAVQFLIDNGLWLLLLLGSFGITGLLLWQTRRRPSVR